MPALCSGGCQGGGGGHGGGSEQRKKDFWKEGKQKPIRFSGVGMGLRRGLSLEIPKAALISFRF